MDLSFLVGMAALMSIQKVGTEMPIWSLVNTEISGFIERIVDQPLGTGFSYTRPGDIPRDEVSIASTMAEFLSRFVYTFPAVQSSRVILSGERYD